MTGAGATRYDTGAYLAANPGWHTEDSPWKARNIAGLLEERRADFETAVEVGCGAGLILQELARLLPGKRWTGYDVSGDAAAFWQRWSNDAVDYVHGDFLSAGAPADLVLAIDVLEHVEDYMGFLRGLRPLGRRFVFHIPLDINGQGLLRGAMLESRRRVGHLHYFSKPTALATLADCGFEVEDCRFTASSQHAGRSERPLRTRIANLPRRLLFPIAPDFTALALGGYSLLVLAQPRVEAERNEANPAPGGAPG